MADNPTDNKNNQNDLGTNPSRSHNLTNVISIIAIIIAIIAIAFSIFVWDQSNRDESQLSTNQKTNQASITARINDLNANLRQQQQNLDATQDDVSHLMKTIGNPERPQALSQISYLINVANLQLRLNQNTEAATHYLTLARNRVNAMSDPSLIDLKRSINNDIHKLQAVSMTDKSSLIFKLDRISERIQSLSTIPSLEQKTVITNNAPTDEHHKKPWYSRFWDSIKGLKQLVTVRHSNQNMSPLLNKDQEQLLKERIAAKINQAEWAILHQNNDLYQHNLKQIKSWLTQFFHSAKDTENIMQILDGLEQENIAPKVPNITDSLSAIRNILSQDNMSPREQPTNKKGA
ncbi:MAG: uroporphyrinogen-III C-methyltransferase [Gammaproteobacteria bacterium]|nr:uroporphyrinogen-III C-methyltransferase [Gammaproteobacteria bacterium]MCH9743503.1 uroporphyrinogen-III C-methyltransferase [Gammaproteobacteria bacterium]